MSTHPLADGLAVIYRHTLARRKPARTPCIGVNYGKICGFGADCSTEYLCTFLIVFRKQGVVFPKLKNLYTFVAIANFIKLERVSRELS